MNRRKFLEVSGAVTASGGLALASPAAYLPLKSDKTFSYEVGVEYYRAPMPPMEMWDEDFAAIRRAGFDSVRTFSSWNWMSPEPGKIELGDFDRMFELAAKHGLKVIFDFTLSTHMACPDWMMRKHPDMRVVYHTGEAAEPFANSAGVQGGNRHCYDHPMWKVYAEEVLRSVVNRYKDSPAMGMWVVWDGPGLPGMGSDVNRPGWSCYCVHTRAKYQQWLKQRFTLEQLSQRLGMRYRTWEDVAAPQSKNLLMAMLLFRQFLYENVAQILKWQVEIVRSLDPKHELHSHGFRYPNPLDERCAQECDSWGFASHSTNLFASEDPYQYSNIAYASQWSRAVGKNRQWWYTEIYSGFYHGGMTYRKQTLPEDLAMCLWMGLIYGAKGAIFWQYRPEYGTHEAPGLNLVTMSGKPLPQLKAIEKAIGSIRSMESHLPLKIPQAEAAIAYDSDNAIVMEMENAKGQQLRFIRGIHRSLWENNIPVDLVTTRMDWSGYKLVFLPHLMLLTQATIDKIRQVRRDHPEIHLFADGILGTNAPTGRFSYDPPEGLTALLGVQVLDYSRIDALDLREGRNRIRTDFGEFTLKQACNYASLEPQGKTRAVATFGREVVGVQTADGRFTYLTVPIGAAFGGLPQAVLKDLPAGHALDGVAPMALLEPFLEAAGVRRPLSTQGSKVIALTRESPAGGSLVFVLNLEASAARVRLTLADRPGRAEDLLQKSQLSVTDGAFSLQIPPRSLKVVHCQA